MSKIIDYKKLITRLWLCLWLCLVILLTMKLLFNKWYPIVCDNEMFIEMCNLIDKNKLLRYAVMFILYIFTSNLLLLTQLEKRKFNSKLEVIITNIIFIMMFTSKFINSILGTICEIIVGVVYPTFVIYKKNKNKVKLLQPLFIYLILNLWQCTIFLVRGINFQELKGIPILIGIILQIDYIIFILITWIGVSYMSLFSWGWLWGKTTTELKAMKKEELGKKHPNERLIAEIDERIKKLETEGK